MTEIGELQNRIEASFAEPDRCLDSEAIQLTVELLDKGIIRVAEPHQGDWRVNEWVKKAVLLFFRVSPMKTINSGTFEYRDKVPVKQNFEEQDVRIVPPATARYGSYLSPGTVLMPSYVNIGAWIGRNTMIDTWATVGSCAQVGDNVHLAGGVGIGGVLEPVQAAPVIVENGVFIGSRCIVVEGARVGEEAVLGANVVITGSTPVIDVTGEDPIEYRGQVPPRAIVIPGTRMKSFPAGEYQLPCGLIIGWRNPAMEDKVAVNDILRQHGVGV